MWPFTKNHNQKYCKKCGRKLELIKTNLLSGKVKYTRYCPWLYHGDTNERGHTCIEWTAK